MSAQHVTALKDEGNRLFADGDVAGAIASYTQAVHACATAAVNVVPAVDSGVLHDGSVAVTEAIPPALLATLHSNLAACFLRIDEPVKAMLHCDACIALDATNTKVSVSVWGMCHVSKYIRRTSSL